jgi:hypothetical protein
MMTAEECFDAWAPSDGIWSQWAKPVLFAQLPSPFEVPASTQAAEPFDPFWIPHGSGHTAVVVDLPGTESVACGMALARRGFRPIPLYNTSPGPAAVIDVTLIARALAAETPALTALHLSPDAAPAFLLDASRMTPAVLPAPGKFDNRWVVFPQDFPSGSYLRSRGVTDVLVLHGDRGLQEDLAHVLLRWQALGLRISGATRADAGRARQLTIQPPSMFRKAWYRALTIAGLRRNNAGGFGGVIPMPSGGGYG